MVHSPTDNAITRRLAKMQDLYVSVYTNVDTKICLWSIDPDESRMVDAFFHTEVSEAGVFDEFFMKLDSPFIKYDGYEAQLLGEFTEKLTNSKELLEEDEIEMDFQILERMNGSQSFFHLVENFRKVIHPADGGLVIFLRPSSVSDIKIFEQWLYHQLQTGWPPKVKIMLSFITGSAAFGSILKDFSESISVLTPDLDMKSAVDEMSAAGNPRDPGVKMRKMIFDMNMAASEGEMDKAEDLGEKAIIYSKTQPNMEHIEPTIHSILGSFLLSQPDKEEEALAHFAQGQERAKKAADAGNPLGTTMLYQSTFSYGSTLVQMKEYEQAAILYEQTALDGAGDQYTVYQRMEAYRLAGVCYYNQNDGEKCWDCSWMALELAEEIDMQTRSYSALPYVGEVLLHYAHTMDRPDSAALVESKMVGLLGKSWRDQLAQQKAREHASR